MSLSEQVMGPDFLRLAPVLRRFHRLAGVHDLRWTRYFPGKTMTSHMRLQDGRVVEQLGAARLTFGLHESQGRLLMQLQGLRFAGVPCPRWLLPRIVAQETGNGELLEFKVSAALPWVGVVTHYEGHLRVPESMACKLVSAPLPGLRPAPLATRPRQSVA